MANQVDDRSRAIGGMHARPAAWFIRGLWFVVRLQVVLVALALMLEGLARSANLVVEARWRDAAGGR